MGRSQRPKSSSAGTTSWSARTWMKRFPSRSASPRSRQAAPSKYGLLRYRSKEGDDVQKITPFLWFDNQAEEAAKFYTSIFKNSKVGKVSRYGETGPGPEGSVMTVEFQLDGQEFIALNGGPEFTFSPAISFF